jgi:hypothetical protein
VADLIFVFPSTNLGDSCRGEIMATDAQPTKSTPKWMFWLGWLISLLCFGMLLFSAYAKLTSHPSLVEGFTKFGWPLELAFWIGIVEIACAVVYIIPQTSILGAILLTGYLGGAVATHVRIQDAYFGPIIGGMLVWGALWLRCGRLRAILPLRL